MMEKKIEAVRGSLSFIWLRKLIEINFGLLKLKVLIKKVFKICYRRKEFM
jgi:hypothetical protein